MVKCPVCKKTHFVVETTYNHGLAWLRCYTCYSVLYFNEIYCVAKYGKRPIDKQLEDSINNLEVILGLRSDDNILNLKPPKWEL